MADLWDNPMGTDGFEFVEYTGARSRSARRRCSSAWASSRRRRHRSKNVTLYRQGDVNFIVNAEPESFAQGFARLHGPSVCAIAFRVKDAAAAYERAIVARRQAGATARSGRWSSTSRRSRASAISLIYLVDRYGDRSTIYDVDFELLCRASSAIRRASA